MKTSKDIEEQYGHRLPVKLNNSYNKSLGKKALHTELYKPLHRNMYK